MATTLTQKFPTQWGLGALSRFSADRLRVMMAFTVPVAGVVRYSTFREYRATAGYVVPTGYELQVSRLLLNAGTISQTWWLVDGTDDVGQSSAVAPAGSVVIDAPMGGTNNGMSATAALVIQEIETFFRIPAGRFPALASAFANSGIIVTLYGIEVPV